MGSCDITFVSIGGIAGKNSKAEFQAPCRTTKYPREIPPLPWYRGTLPQMAMAGFLPFSAIYIELYYIFASVWGHRIYTIYSILFIVFIILLIVTAFITVALTYFQLAAEDHEWWWRSFLCGGSTGLFIYGYCLYYYYARVPCCFVLCAPHISLDKVRVKIRLFIFCPLDWNMLPARMCVSYDG
ncbi:Transmembrane 9 superfamily member 3 [Sesamum alatum]|uniref:Transmembrane 9 superfamily member n=1 Tax=Sesamum alatum TaxID=300844 RepID=A0AAE1XS42_9LAMI|nr:Transmembrane 9 superfamily member 3 [Sesamum alatum]